MSSPSAPPPPDYAGAAHATAAGNLEAMRAATQANRYDEYTPFGSRTWTSLAEPVFDEEGFNRAMADYNARFGPKDPEAAGTTPVGGGGGGEDPNLSDTIPHGDRYAPGTDKLPLPPGADRIPTPKIFGRSATTGSSPAPVSDPRAEDPTGRSLTGRSLAPILPPTREQFTTTRDQDKWRSDISLSPEVQGILDKNLDLQSLMADLGITSAEQMDELLGTQFSIDRSTPEYAGPEGDVPTYEGPGGETPTYGGTKQRVMDAMLSRVSSDVSRDRDNKHSQLISQGIPPGSEAYNREMERFDRQMTDARQQAEIQATGMAGREFESEMAGRRLSNEEATRRYRAAMEGRGLERQEALTGYQTGLDTHRQAIQDALLERQIPLNEMSAFRSGGQIQLPQFQQTASQGPTAGPDLLRALQAQSGYDMGAYNADLAQSQNLQSGLFGLGAAMLMSDERLKEHKVLIGSTPSGIGVYEFNYIGDDARHIGVMAQEVLPRIPQAVITMPSGFYAVDYSMVN